MQQGTKLKKKNQKYRKKIFELKRKKSVILAKPFLCVKRVSVTLGHSMLLCHFKPHPLQEPAPSMLFIGLRFTCFVI